MVNNPLRKFAIFVTALALAACGSGEREVDIAAQQGILLVGNYGEPATLDSLKSRFFEQVDEKTAQSRAAFAAL